MSRMVAKNQRSAVGWDNDLVPSGNKSLFGSDSIDHGLGHQTGILN